MWLEKFVDDVTCESVTVECFNCLLKADDKEHWMSDVDASDYDAGAIYYVALTVYASKGDAVVFLKDTLLGAFPDIAYIAKGGYRIE